MPRIVRKEFKGDKTVGFSESTVRKWIIDLNKDSVRKFRLGYLPVKERLLLEGDERINFQRSYLTFINEYFKWRRQVKIGHAELPPMDAMRFDFKPIICDRMDLLGPEWISKLCS